MSYQRPLRKMRCVWCDGYGVTQDGGACPEKHGDWKRQSEIKPAPKTMNQETALYYSQIACDKVITQSRLHIEFYGSLNRLTPEEKRILEELIVEFEEVKEYLKENLV